MVAMRPRGNIFLCSAKARASIGPTSLRMSEFCGNELNVQVSVRISVSINDFKLASPRLFRIRIPAVAGKSRCMVRSYIDAGLLNAVLFGKLMAECTQQMPSSLEYPLTSWL